VISLRGYRFAQPPANGCDLFEVDIARFLWLQRVLTLHTTIALQARTRELRPLLHRQTLALLVPHKAEAVIPMDVVHLGEVGA